MSQPTGNEPENKPWYQRPLPAFVPPWLIICLAFGGGLAFIATYIPNDRAKVRAAAAIGFAVGFCFGVVSLVWTHLFHRKFEPSSGLVPPLLVAGPIAVAAAAALGVFTVQERDFLLVQGTFIRGYAAVILGLLIIIAAGCVSGTMIRSSAEGVDRLIAGISGVCISLAALVFAVVRIWQHGHA